MSKEKELVIPDKAIPLMIRHENFCAYISFKEFIEKKMKARIPVPKRVFERFVSLIEPVNTEKEIRQKYNDDAISLATDRFSVKGYWFEFMVNKCDVPRTFDIDEFGKFKFTVKDKKPKKTAMNTGHLISSVFSDINSLMNSEKTALKGEVVRSAYLSIKKFIEYNFETKTQIAFLSHYKASVIATYIAIKFGYKFTSTIPKKNEYSNPQLFASSRAEIDKLGEQKISDKTPKKMPKSK